MVIKKETYYFEKPGDQNTKQLLTIVKKRAIEQKVKYVVVASTRGNSGVMAAEVFKDTDINLVVVTHQTGHHSSGIQLLTQENQEKLEAMNIKIITGTDALTGGVGIGLSHLPRPLERPDDDTIKMIRTILAYTQSLPPIESVVASTLRLFCEGLKVTVEIVLMAADAAAIPIDQDVIAIAGTGRGADTAILVKPANTTYFPQMEIYEIIAKPYTKVRN